MMLLIDAGNSRIKSAVHGEAGITDISAVDAHRQGVVSTLIAAALARTRHGLGRVIVANVAGDRFARSLVEVCRETGAPEPEFMVSTRHLGGVTNAYADPAQLGIDRWLAIVAAFAMYGTDLCVIDAGSALTIDGVDSHGNHLGGCIAPGLDMMRSALLRDTSDLEYLSRDGSDKTDDCFATDTRAAIGSGCRNAVTGLVRQAVDDMTARTGARPSIVMTGGNAFAVKSTTRLSATHIPDLVLRGLVVAALENS